MIGVKPAVAIGADATAEARRAIAVAVQVQVIYRNLLICGEWGAGKSSLLTTGTNQVSPGENRG